MAKDQTPIVTHPVAARIKVLPIEPYEDEDNAVNNMTQQADPELGHILILNSIEYTFLCNEGYIAQYQDGFLKCVNKRYHDRPIYWICFAHDSEWRPCVYLYDEENFRWGITQAYARITLSKYLHDVEGLTNQEIKDVCNGIIQFARLQLE